MNNSLIITKLNKAGFSITEAKIFLTLYLNGTQSILEISQNTNINRSKIYRTVSEMISKNLLLQSFSSRGTKYNAIHPEKLNLQINKLQDDLLQKTKDITELILALDSLPVSLVTNFEIINYKGQEGMRQMMWNQTKAKKILLYMHETRNEMVGKNFAEKIRLEFIIKNIKLYGLFNNKCQSNNFYTKLTNWKNVYKGKYIDKRTLMIQHQIYIYNDVLSIMNHVNGEVTGIEIINQPLSNMQMQMFWKFWNDT